MLLELFFSFSSGSLKQGPLQWMLDESDEDIKINKSGKCFIKGQRIAAERKAASKEMVYESLKDSRGL